MLARYSIRELAHRPLRTCLAFVGVAVATAMLVDMLMLGSGIQRSFSSLLEARGYELRVSPKGTLPFDTEATVPNFSGLLDTLLASPGVAGVAPTLASSVTLSPVPQSSVPGSSVAVSSIPGFSTGSAETTTDSVSRADAGERPVRSVALGIYPEEQGILRLLEGELPLRGEILLDRSSLEVLGSTIGGEIRVGIGAGLGVVNRTATMRVAGTAEFLFAARDESPVALHLEDLQQLSGDLDEVSFAMVRLTDGADPEMVRAELIRRIQRAEIVTIAGVLEKASERLSYFRQLALILGSVSLVVTALLVGTIMAVSISERLGTIAALRAIGVSRANIVVGLTAESLVLCAIAGAAGLGLGVVVAGYLESILSDFPGLPQSVQFFVLRPDNLIAAYALLLLVGSCSAMLPAWRATHLHVATTLHAEEP